MSRICVVVIIGIITDRVILCRIYHYVCMQHMKTASNFVLGTQFICRVSKCMRSIILKLICVPRTARWER